MKKVSNLLNNIGTCRNLLEENDFKKIRGYIGIFEKTQNEIVRNINRYMFDRKTMIDFTIDDLKELSGEIKSYLENNYPIEFTYDGFMKVLEKTQNGKIDNDVFRQYVKQVCDYLYVDTKLRETMKIIAYVAVLYKVWQLNYQKNENEEDIMFQITDAIKSCLR